MSNETVESLLNKMAGVLEEHTAIFLIHRQNFEHIHREIGRIKKRLGTLESLDPDKPADAEFVADMTGRLEAIKNTLATKP